MEKKSRAFGSKHRISDPENQIHNQRFIFQAIALSVLVTVFLAFSFTLPGTKKDAGQEPKVRKPAAAGTFYPSDKITLENFVDTLLQQADLPPINDPVRAIIVPHAGYIYSGPVAAKAYQALKGQNIRTVVLMSNSHTERFGGISIYSQGSFETPLGLVEIDSSMAQKLIAAHSQIIDRPSAHLTDHTLEVQLPFLQRILTQNDAEQSRKNQKNHSDFRIVPIEFGNDSLELCQILAEALKNNLDDKTLIVASTDMSHYPSYNDASAADQETIQAILTGEVKNLDITLANLDSKRLPNTQTFLCGVSAVRTTLLLNQALGPWDIRLLKYANSGDVTGDQNRVVGYSSIVFTQPKKENQPTGTPLPPAQNTGTFSELLSKQEQKELLTLARLTVESYIVNRKMPNDSPTLIKLREKRGAFVTIRVNGRLRGCIGQFEPNLPLYRVVQQVAIAAAMQDPRFRPVDTTELQKLEYEISVLSPLKRIRDAKEIEMGKHGVQVSQGFHSGVFLPQVATETGWDKETFLNELCTQKAGLPENCWKDPDVSLKIFTAQVFSEDKK